jgi:histone-lysine N-methyltransferase SUV39H
MWEDSTDPTSWEEVFFNLRWNIIFMDYINQYFEDKSNEASSYVQIANVKQKVKFKIRKSLRTLTKFEIMQTIQEFDPFDFKVHQVFYHKFPHAPRFDEVMENLVYASHFFRLDQTQRYNHNAFIETVKRADPHITLEIDNSFDFELLPPNFTYITKNILVDDLNLTASNSPQKCHSNLLGCKCAKGICDAYSDCCPKLINRKLPFAYKKGKNGNRLVLHKMEEIYECNDKCSCNKDCLNRLSQQQQKIKVCLFKTSNRGYGLRSCDNIKKGTFIMEYVGELLGGAEAGKREVNNYLFDLNMDRLDSGFYTIDAFNYGNLARFINHSCDPNCWMFFINDCQKDPKNQKLCIFAMKDIASDTEITIDYCPRDSIPTTDKQNYSQSFHIECQCGSENCRGTIY